MTELPNASSERARVSSILKRRRIDSQLTSSGNADLPSPSTPDIMRNHEFESSPLFKHLAHGLAYTTGSALGASPPSLEACLGAYQVSNSAGLTAGSRAWSKHCHRSQIQNQSESEITPSAHEGDAEKQERCKAKSKRNKNEGWWGTASGPISVINEKSLALFWKVMNGATWRNLHWLPHQILVYEVRLAEGDGMRWARDLSGCDIGPEVNVQLENRPWIFRGFLEPQMENGHEVGWRHTISSRYKDRLG